MRTAFLQRRDIRCEYVAVIEKTSGRVAFSKKYGMQYIRTVCLKDVCDANTGEYLADHAWIDAPKVMINLSEGDSVRFSAIASPYKKQGETDYRLTCITRVVHIETFYGDRE